MEKELSKSNFLLKNLGLSRRRFLQTVGLLSVSPLAACSKANSTEDFIYGGDSTDYYPPVADETGAKWVHPYCTFGCGGPCLNNVLVKDGVLLRHGTDDFKKDDPNYIPYKTCVKGRSLRVGYYAADRLRYPMKRKNWNPGGGENSNGSLRGQDQWERISWEQAYEYITSEITRIKDAYGIKSIATPRCNSNFLKQLGGAFVPNAFTSEGTQPMVMQCVLGEKQIHTANSDRLQFRKSKLLIMFGFNPAWSCNNNINMTLQDIKNHGVKIIVIDPMFTHSSAVLADQWIPIRPATDTAFLLGAAYYMIENNLHNQDFLNKYTVGFDKDHMPSGAAADAENFKDYILGTYDSVPKTPEWASKICGVPAEVIKEFAREAALTSPAIWYASTSNCRTHAGEQFTHAFFTVGWMTGNVGKEGAGVFHNYGRMYLQSSKYAIGTTALSRDVAAAGSKPCHHEEFYDAILTGKYTSGYNTETQEPVLSDCNIKMVYSIAAGSKGDFINQFRGVHKGLKALRSLEFIVTNDIFMSPLAQHADIVLPDTSHWERGPQFHVSYKPDVRFYSEQVSEPFFEAKNGAVVEVELAKKFGIDLPEVDMNKSFFDSLYNTKIVDEFGEQKPLVSFSEEDLASFGDYAQGKVPQHGEVSLLELKVNGMYTPKRYDNDAYDFIAYKSFIDNPEGSPLPTESGKMEIYCSKLANTVESYGFTKKDPLPKYFPIEYGYEATFKDNNIDGEKGDYPFQIFNFRRVNAGHSTLYNISALKEVMPHNIYINKADADSKGIAQNDIVLVSSQAGKLIIRAYVTERIAPGVVAMGEGAWFNMQEENGELIDIGGCVNTLSDSLPSGTNVPYNNIVNIEKYTGSLNPDVWEPIIPVSEEE